MPVVTIHTLEPLSRGDAGKMLVSLDTLPLPAEFTVYERAFVCLPAGVAGGNHTHACAEAFIACDPDTEVHWLDEQGTHHVERFVVGDNVRLIVVPAGTPHAVKNTASHPIMLLEFRDGPLADVIPIHVI